MNVVTRTISVMIWLLTAFTVPQGAAFAATSGRLQIPDGQTLLLSAEGVGHQIYISQPKSGTTEFEWVLKEPQAKLYANSRMEIGKHYADPTTGKPAWQSEDGSEVVGTKKDSVPAPEAADIPWLLVEAISHKNAGIFSEVSYILRIDTEGGMAPAKAPMSQGQEARVKYRATYIFLAPAVAR
jgi:hypothetical protein